jgi:hypothetical protein
MSGSNALLDSLAHPAQVNLLDLYGKAAGAGQAIWANRLAQSQQAVGAAQQGAVGPDGVFSQNRANQLIADTGSSGALAAGAGLESSQRLSDAQLEQAFKKTGYVAKTAAGALADPNFDYSDASMMKLLAQGSADNMLTIPEITKQLQTLPPDAAGRKQWLAQHQSQALSQEQLLELQYGKTGTATDPQGRLVGTMQDRRSAAMSSPQQPGVGQGPSQDALSGVSTITKSDGSQVTDTLAGHIRNGRVSPTGAPMPGYQAAPPAATSARPAAGLPGGPGPHGNPNAFDGLPRPQLAIPPSGNPLYGPLPDEPAAAAPTPTGPKEGGTTVAPGVLARQTADREEFTKAQANVGPANTSVHNLQNAYQALSLTNSGSGTEATHKLYAFIANQAPDWLKSQRLTDDVKNYDLFRKYTEKYALDQGAQSNTDAGRAMSAQSNAGTAISTPANLDVMRYEVGRQRQSIASALLQKDPTGNGFGQANAEHMNSTDPHGFAWDMYSPQERQAFIDKARKDGTYDKLVKSVQAAVDSHQIANPKAQ